MLSTLWAVCGMYDRCVSLVVHIVCVLRGLLCSSDHIVGCMMYDRCVSLVVHIVGCLWGV